MTKTKEVEWVKVESWRFWKPEYKAKAIAALEKALGILRQAKVKDVLRPNDINNHILIREEYQLGSVFKVEIIVTSVKHRVTVTLFAKKEYRIKVKLPNIERICR